MPSRPIAILAVVVAAAAAAAPAFAQERQARKLRVATAVYEELAGEQGVVPAGLLESSRCVAVIPGVVKGAFGIGGRNGNGVLSCRLAEGTWSPPVFINMTGVSLGFQIGAESADIALFFMTDRGVRSLLQSKFTLGGDASVAAGPVGRSAQAGTDLKLNAEIYSYARSRGLFAGVSVEGARLAPDQKDLTAYYGERMWPDEVLFEGKVPSVPIEAQTFIDAVGRSEQE